MIAVRGEKMGRVVSLMLGHPVLAWPDSGCVRGRNATLRVAGTTSSIYICRENVSGFVRSMSADCRGITSLRGRNERS